MATRSLNRVQLIGNLTRDPELRYTPQGVAVCTFGLATNREWTVESGEKKEEAEFHRVVTWNKLAEICNQFLTKGRKVFVEGRLQTRQWEAQDGAKRQQTEIVASDMIILDNRGKDGGSEGETTVQADQPATATSVKKTEDDKAVGGEEVKPVQAEKTVKDTAEDDVQEIDSNDIPF